jgi:hypothetical protein
MAGYKFGPDHPAFTGLPVWHTSKILNHRIRLRTWNQPYNSGRKRSTYAMKAASETKFLPCQVN